MTLSKLSSFSARASRKNKQTIAIAAANDKEVLLAVKQAVEQQTVSPLLFGNRQQILQLLEEITLSLPDKNIIEAESPQDAAKQAARAVADGKAQIIMKGLVSTGDFLKAIIKRKLGLIDGGLLSHIAFIESPAYHKLLCITDAAMNIAPDFNDKIKILQNAIKTYSQLGISEPKAAAIAAVETVNPRMEATVHAAMLERMNKRGQLNGCILDGPLALDNAISKEAARQKNIGGPVAGDADILLLPDINTGNVLYKSLNFLGGSKSAALITGAKVPIVLTSRADNHDSKFFSIALATALN